MFDQYPHSFRCGLRCVVPPGLQGTENLSAAGNRRQFPGDFSTMSDCKNAPRPRGEKRGGTNGGSGAISAQADDGRHPGGGGGGEKMGGMGGARTKRQGQT